MHEDVNMCCSCPNTFLKQMETQYIPFWFWLEKLHISNNTDAMHFYRGVVVNIQPCLLQCRIFDYIVFRLLIL